jgi:UvrB/uvrC motif
VNQDIDFVLRGWDYKPGVVQARLVEALDRRQVIQMRVDLGVLQLEVDGRPDGTEPQGFATYFDYLQERSRGAQKAGQPFVLDEEQSQEADHEFLQFYHRRVCWLALREYAKAIRDADHTLNFMDLVKRHSPGDEYTQAHEQYRPFVLFHRTQAASALAVEKDNPELAIDELRDGLERLNAFFIDFGVEDQMEEDPMVQHLRKIETTLREQYHIGATMHEQLDQAIAAEDYERAAQLRDALKRRKR